MRVTTIISDKLIEKVRYYTNGKNITESLEIALNEWLELKHIKELNQKIEKKSLKFIDGYSAEKVRKINRK